MSQKGKNVTEGNSLSRRGMSCEEGKNYIIEGNFSLRRKITEKMTFIQIEKIYFKRSEKIYFKSEEKSNINFTSFIHGKRLKDHGMTSSELAHYSVASWVIYAMCSSFGIK